MPDWTRETPWRQGHLLPPEAVRSLGLIPDAASRENALVVVASHDCDIAQSPTIEPTIEVIVGSRIADLDGNFTHAKNARKLHVKFDSEIPLLAEFVAGNMKPISKESLISHDPDERHRLSPTAKNTFQCWLAARYRRSSFPDEFETRLKNKPAKLDEAIAKAVKSHGESIVKILFDVDDGQEVIHRGMEDAYRLGIFLLYAVEPDEAESRASAEKAKFDIETAFSSKARNGHMGIELIYVDIISEEALTYRQFMLLRPWRLDYISLGSEPQQPMPTE